MKLSTQIVCASAITAASVIVPLLGGAVEPIVPDVAAGGTLTFVPGEKVQGAETLSAVWPDSGTR